MDQTELDVLSNEKKSSFENEKKLIDFILIYTNKMKYIQEKILDLLDNNEEQNYDVYFLISYLDEIEIQTNKSNLKSLLHLLNTISENHFRNPDFFIKIEAILFHYQKEMMKYFSNFEIFNIFKSNKRILLYLFKSKTIILNENIMHVICNKKYKERKYTDYFSAEINAYKKENEEESKENDKKRIIGENDTIICEFIRNDLVKEFISYVNQTNFSLSSNIESSVFETNSFLINKNPSLIEYAAFFGSIQILRFLIFNKVELTPSLWLYSIHGRNPEIIHLLEDNHILPNDSSYYECYIESIKCHHYEISNYIKDNLLFMKSIDTEKIFQMNLKSYNFLDFSSNLTFDFNMLVFYFGKYDYIDIFEYLCNSIKIDPNLKIKDEIKGITKINTILTTVVKKGNIEILRILLSEYDIDVNFLMSKTYIKSSKENDSNSTNPKIKTEITEEKTSLSIAVENGNMEIVQLLLSNPKIDINIANSNKTSKDKDNHCSNIKSEEYKTPLIMAIENGQFEICKLLLSNKANTNSKYIKKFICIKRYSKRRYEIPGLYEKIEEKVPLIIAIEKGNVCMVQLLLSALMIDINLKYTKQTNYKEIEKSYEEQTFLTTAIENQNLEIIKLLLARKDINLNDNQIIRLNGKKRITEKNALIIATEKNNSDIVQVLLEREDIDVNAKSKIYVPLVIAHPGYTSFFNELTLADEKTALSIAIEKNNEKIVQLLLQRKDINVNSKLIAKNTKSYINIYKFNFMIDEVNSEFILSIEKGNINIIKSLLNINNLDVNFISKISTKSSIYIYNEFDGGCSSAYKKFEDKIEQKTALHIAVQNNSVEIVKLLLSRPEISVNDRYICEKKQTYILISKEKSKKQEETALHIAIQNQNIDIIRLLLSNHKTDVNLEYIKDSNLYKAPIIKTAVIMAVQEKNKDIIKLLLSDKNIKISKELKNDNALSSLLSE